ncbi:MAG: ABC transporter substrate-binding protein [Alphaproteobacteria bacterium]|nr:ABC transporter substrate-binding protein [Alphaproteobacteria bacterium]
MEISLCILGLGSFAGIARADPGVVSAKTEAKVVINSAYDAEKFVIEHGEIALAAISEKNFEKKCLSVSGLIDGIFDIGIMGRVALGRFSKQATDYELAQYQSLFKDYLFYSFLTKDIIDGVQSFKIAGSSRASKRDALVAARVLLSKEANLIPAASDSSLGVDMEFRVRKFKNDDMRIINVKVLEFDLVAALRAEMRKLMSASSGDFEEFLFELGELVSQLKGGNDCGVFIKANVQS